MTAVGDVFERRGQTYRCVHAETHPNRSGNAITYPVLVSNCTECGAQFRLKATETAIKQGTLGRRCPRHKRRLVQTTSVRPTWVARGHYRGG